ncbi:phenylalanine--tRNA ligase subunit beta [Enterococcus saccharolyticus]|uniref:Phenylalanine--tRNA ligase beta subunit n=1 Tax=Enterococcus saccharolyticus subsp. saccharolyticus ATCC 43076 TaxID=1139996 RepID=S0NXT4_9ENTE|nr:phenylalanine--tRNA ligase subunit beta [Enterococcus saccharolyticus]EOT28952.1 phenylalanyl-tRNA synthetase beta chain [Enterococcus saccharolyticus subsp. saccharolyticus ATCC 43076]EOT81318.1 phenylalanyl-tRNA synthetase beta chain [Enterococcus saccharolyticus subsp. saccharolyticus ATCC 43076]OJG90323.1 phenylalanyl-tRNA synthetase beta chain [Enterococcus saccharolyticus]
MLVSYKWLNEYLDLSKVSPQELADKMSVTGIEVEAVEVPAEGLKKIVVGEVIECVDHPDSDHLHICQVNIGEEELSQIVCGAPNVKAGIKVIVALPNSRIAGNVKIKKGKMRGQVSNGMICSLEEIGYSDSVIPKEYSEGIQYLPADAVPGEPVFSYLDMDDAIIELSITPNRADALSMRGVAYEVGAIYNQVPNFKKEELQEVAKPASEKISVNVTDTTDTPSYQIRIIENVKIAASPQWLQNILMNAGIRPINNVVDVTNYILLLFGQPLHAFDYDKLGSQEIVVRRAQAEEELVTLDGVTRQLTTENIVITNGQVPVALAGVMGGLDSEIDNQTTTVALEAALFEPLSIRRTSKQFNLRSESSSRFEKGINKATVDQACDVAAAMIANLAGGEVLSGAVKGAEVVAKDVEVEITLARINNYLGTALTVAEVNGIFDALGFVYSENDDHYVVVVPPRRWDISIEADIIEEVARIYGYNNLPSTLPSGETVAGALTREQRLTRKVRSLFEGNGLSEAISYALTTEEKSMQFMMKESQPTRLDWPMTEDRSVLRLNLISGLLDDVAYNVARKNTQLALYEVGRVFYQNEEANVALPIEETHIAFALSGEWTTKDWQGKGEKVDFYHAKGVLDNLFAMLSLEDVITFEKTSEMKEMHPGRTANIYLGETKVGFIGQVHPSVAKAYDVPETYVAELNLEALLANDAGKLIYQAVSKFPAVSRDIALLVKEEISNQEIVKEIKQAAGKFLTNVEIFDVYQGKNIEAGHKSLAYSLTFVNPEATLTDEEINRAMDKVTKALTESFEAVIR